MTYIGGIIESFKGTEEVLNYKLRFRNPDPNNLFSFSFGSSGVDPEAVDVTGMKFLSISGQGGKLFDNEENYFHSYSKDESMEIEGNIFNDYHNYSVNGVLINTNCARREGEINSFYYSGISASHFECFINEYYEPI